MAVSNWELGRNPIAPPMEELLRRVFADVGIHVGAGAEKAQARRRRRKVV
jgi:hypothetical protein